MMGKIEHYRRILRETQEWEPFLRENSGLPGPRGNLELAYAVAEEGNVEIFQRLLACDTPKTEENTPDVFLVFCGLVGLGEALKQSDGCFFNILKAYANDPRWRIREAVAIAFQVYAPSNPKQLIEWMNDLARGTLLQQRAAVAALCEPANLVDTQMCVKVLQILHAVTFHLSQEIDRKSEPFRVLRQTLGYAWSVVIAAVPEIGKPALEPWFESIDPDVLWILKENLTKKRLLRLDPGWVQQSLDRIKRVTDRR